MTPVHPGLSMEHNHLQLRHLLHGVPGALLAHTTVLQSAVGHQVGAEGWARVYVQVARVDLGGEAQGQVQDLARDGPSLVSTPVAVDTPSAG